MASFSVQSPATVGTDRGTTSLTLIGTGTSWSHSTPFAVSGVAGVSLLLVAVNGATSASLVLRTGPTTGTLTVTDGVSQATIQVKRKPRIRWFPGLNDRRYHKR